MLKGTSAGVFLIAVVLSVHGFLQPLPGTARQRWQEVQRQRIPLFASTADAVAETVSGEHLDEMNLTVSEELPFAPPLSFDKFVTMQEKRVVVTVRYTQGLKAFYLTVARKIKQSHPDVLIEKRIFPKSDEDAATFDVLVDGKVILGTSQLGKGRKQRLSADNTAGPSVFVSMHDFDVAIAKARRKRRPSTLYGDEKQAAVRQILKKNQDGAVVDEKHLHWKDN